MNIDPVAMIGLLFVTVISFFMGATIAINTPIEYKYILKSIMSMPLEARKNIIEQLKKDCLK